MKLTCRSAPGSRWTVVVRDVFDVVRDVKADRPLAFLDLLFNCGPESTSVLAGAAAEACS